MKRKSAYPALTAAAVMLCSLYTIPAHSLTAAAYQPAEGANIQEAENRQWKDDGRLYKVTTQNDPLNMRADADLSAPVLTTVPKGTILKVLQTCDGWGKVQYGSFTGCCAMEWLTLVQDNAADQASSPVTENDPEKNEKTIYRYLTETLGLSSAAACGIIGNIHVETGGTFDPTAHNPEDTGGTQGYGICQWNSGADAGYRMEELQAYSPEWKTLECQLDFIRNDLLHNTYLLSLHLYDDLKAIGNTEEDAVTASDIWAARYEGCAKWTYEARREKARFYYGEHNSKSLQWKDTAQTCIVATQSGSLNMRSAPSIFDSILVTIPKDAAVSVKSISEDGRWAKVEYKGFTGYCVTEYLKEALPAPAETGTVIRGDLNGDAQVGADDAQLTLKAYTDRIADKSMNLTDAQIKAADVDGNGQISVEDAQLILKYYTAKYIAFSNITWEQLLRA